jgi:hypothetical protein
LDVSRRATDVDPVERIARMSVDFVIFLEPVVETAEIKDDEAGEIRVVGDIARTYRATGVGSKNHTVPVNVVARGAVGSLLIRLRVDDRNDYILSRYGIGRYSLMRFPHEYGSFTVNGNLRPHESPHAFGSRFMP